MSLTFLKVFKGDFIYIIYTNILGSTSSLGADKYVAGWLVIRACGNNKNHLSSTFYVGGIQIDRGGGLPVEGIVSGFHD
jgi:hypothetical protein